MAKGKPKPRPEGQLRQSQLITTFGPGAMVDLVDRAVVIGGLEHWSYGRDDQGEPLDDPRLRRALIPRLKALHPDLDLDTSNYFRKAPECDLGDPSIFAGIRALEFPRWFVCQQCRRLARAADQFENKGGRYIHHCDGRNRRGHAVPVRFVGACRLGHLTDFPWEPFAHLDAETDCERPELYLSEGATGDFGQIVVSCRTCGSRQPMNRATAGSPFRCNGDRPWLGGRAASEPCEEQLKLLVRTGSDAYFSQVVSALRLPEAEPTAVLVRVRRKDVWKMLKDVTNPGEVETLLKLVSDLRTALDGFEAGEIYDAVETERGVAAGDAGPPIRSAEFARMASAPLEAPGQVPPANAEFAAYRVPETRIDLPKGIANLVVVPELREVRVQVSFSRFDSVNANLQGEFDYENAKTKPAPLTMPGGNERWLPAAEVGGEGIFMEFDEGAVQAWEKLPAVVERTEKLLRAYEADGRGDEFPGARFYMLHSFSHLLMTAISLECGYASSALRERIYCNPPGSAEPPMAAVLISTGTTGSEGTLGGLVEEGRRLRRHVREAWDMGRLCSNDPVCAAHDPSSDNSDRRTEGAACHGCLYVAESSCERFNRFLDRALVIPTIGNDPSLAFFSERP